MWPHIILYYLFSFWLQESYGYGNSQYCSTVVWKKYTAIVGVHCYQTTQSHIPKRGSLLCYGHESLKCHRLQTQCFPTSNNENWLKVCKFCIVLIFCIKMPVKIIENLDIFFPFLMCVCVCVCVMCAYWWCKLCNHSTVHPSTASPDKLQTSWGGWPEHQSRIPCDFSLPLYPVLQVLFHPEYLLQRRLQFATWTRLGSGRYWWGLLVRWRTVPKHICWVAYRHILLDYWWSCLRGKFGMCPFYWFPHVVWYYLFYVGENLGSLATGNNMGLRV